MAKLTDAELDAHMAELMCEMSRTRTVVTVTKPQLRALIAAQDQEHHTKGDAAAPLALPDAPASVFRRPEMKPENDAKLAALRAWHFDRLRDVKDPQRVADRQAAANAAQGGGARGLR